MSSFEVQVPQLGCGVYASGIHPELKKGFYFGICDEILDAVISVENNGQQTIIQTHDSMQFYSFYVAKIPRGRKKMDEVILFKDYIEDNYDGKVAKYAKAKGASKSTIMRWIETECVVYNGYVYAPRQPI